MQFAECTIQPESTVLDRNYLPTAPLYGNAGEAGVGWQLSPRPFELSERHLEDLNRLGGMLLRFTRAIDLLYRQSTKGQMPGWIAELYEQGKPDSLITFSQMKRFKSQLPLVLRPDLLLDEQGWTLCEIDAVPGGIGFTSALNQAYRQSGFSVLEPEGGMPKAFLEMLKALVPEKENPVIAIILSDEAADYRLEMQWLVEQLQPDYPDIALLHPRDVELVRDRLMFSHHGEEKAIDVIYRFFELFDLPNIPKIELIQYAVKKGLVVCTPPFKPQVEEKLSLALLHHPVLADFWQKELGAEDFAQLKQWVPQGWVVDPAPLPPQAVIPNLMPKGKSVQSFGELKALSQKERELVLKPSGFSPLGWGSRGVTVGHDHPQEAWSERLDEAMASFGKTPYILQNFRAAGVTEMARFKGDSQEVASFKARVRLCPYYFVIGDEAKLAGALATACSADKKIIHGMKDAVLAPSCPG